MARLAPIQLQLEIRAGDHDLEAPLGPSSTAHPVGAPTYLIRKLPVFTYASASRSDQLDISKADQGNSCSTKDSAGTDTGLRVQSQLPKPPAAVLAAPAETTANTQVSDAATSAGTPTNTSHSSSNPELQLQQHSNEACTPQQQQQQNTSWVQQLIHQQHSRVINDLSLNRDDQADVYNSNSQQPQQQLHDRGQMEQHHAQPHDERFKQEGEEACIICLSDYVQGELLKQLPCKHIYHAECVDKWLRRNGTCPLCKVSIVRPASRTAEASEEARPDTMVPAVLNAARTTNSAAATAAAATATTTELHVPPSARLTAHILAELQQQRRLSSSNRSTTFGSSGISRWDSMLLSSRGSLAAAGAVAAAGGAVARA